MPAAITADQMLARVKARAMVPPTEGRLTDAEILSLIDDVCITALGRAVYDADDGRWVKTAADVTLTTSQAQYRLPARAFASGLDEAILVSASGDLSQLEYVDRSDVWEWGTATGVPRAYTLIGDVVHLLPTPSSASYSLRLRYVRRPSALTAVANCAVIASVVNSTQLGYSSVPATGWGDAADHTVDIVESTNNVEALEDDVFVSVVTATSRLTRSSGSWASTGAYAIVAGSYACPAGTTCVVQVPDVAIGYLANLGARDVCAAFDDASGADRCDRLAELSRRDMEQAIAERSRTRPKIVQRNSPLRVGGASRARWWGR